MAARLATSKFFAHDDAAAAKSSVDGEALSDMQVPRVRVLYAYEGNGISLRRDEVLALLEKTNADWWRM